MATTNFEMGQLLKAYRKGLISDELFEAQLKEINGGGQNYTYDGKSYSTEREMILHLLDEFRCGENFAAKYLNRWIEVSDQACVKGGLRVVQQRENYHAQLLEARLRELGGIPQCAVPAERREKELAFYSSTAAKDAEKLGSIMARLKGKDLAAVLKPLTDAIGQIQEDQNAARQNRFTVPRAALEMSRAAETIKVRPVQVPGPAGDVIGYRREDRASGSSKPRFFALEMNANEIVPFIVGGARFRQIRLDDPLVIQLRELSRVDADLGREANRLTNRWREQLNEKDCIRSAQALKR